MIKFAFQEIQVWQDAITIGGELAELADLLEAKRLFGFADQLRNAALNISKYIAQSTSLEVLREQKSALNKARRECFEVVSMLCFLRKREFISEDQLHYFLPKLDEQSKMIEKYAASLW